MTPDDTAQNAATLVALLTKCIARPSLPGTRHRAPSGRSSSRKEHAHVHELTKGRVVEREAMFLLDLPERLADRLTLEALERREQLSIGLHHSAAVLCRKHEAARAVRELLDDE